MKNEKNSTFDVLKYIFIIFAIGNLLYLSVMFLIGDTSDVKEFAVRTGICVLINAALLIFTEICETAERYFLKRRSSVDFYGDGNLMLLKCSGGYAMFPAVTVLLDFIIGFMFIKQYRIDPNEIIKFFHSDEMVFPCLYLMIINCCCVFVILYYCCYKVYYNRRYIERVSFFGKKSILCSEIKSVNYYNHADFMRRKIVVKTADDEITFYAKRVCDGWEEFSEYIMKIASEYRITVIAGDKNK